jgi:3-hydroxybutyryl-CoA dehydrogenase
MNALPTRVGVIGGGRMGAGIAHAFLVSGCDVVVIEPNTPARTAETINVSLDKSLERGLGGTRQEWSERLSIRESQEHLSEVDLAVEACPEMWDLKLSILREAESFLPDGAALASNTSSFSISGLAKELERPERFLGLHFFNPVPVSKLIEVVVGASTPHGLVDDAHGWVAGLGKTAIVVKDAPGFASSRLGNALALEAIRMVESGVASAEDIDNALVLGYGHAAGPLRTTDIVGLDVRLNIAEYLAKELGERFTPPQLMRDMVERGELGRKSGKGFYDWS